MENDFGCLEAGEVSAMRLTLKNNNSHKCSLI